MRLDDAHSNRRVSLMTGTASVQPQLYATDGRAAVDFYTQAFGATVLHRIGGTDDDPAIVAQLAVGDGAFWVTSEHASMGRVSPLSAGSSSCRLLLVVSDPQAVVDSAVAAGATLTAAVEAGHGWVMGRVIDPAGFEWEIGKPTGDWPPVED
jgi:PhnB protein